MAIVRFGVSLEKELLEALDNYVEQNRFANRSQAIRHIVNNHITDTKWQCNNLVAGSITLVFDHHKRGLVEQLTEVQHNYHSVIISSLHVHFDHDLCMEVIAVKGHAATLTELADKLIAVKGIRHGKLTMSRAD